MWEKSSQYLRKIGGVILISSIIFWALSYFPLNVNYSKDYNSEIAAIDKSFYIIKSNTDPADTALLRSNEMKKQQEIRNILLMKKAEQKELSYLGRFGHFIEPVIRPLGFDWRIGISIISGIPAKEIIVSSLAVLYHVDPNADTKRQNLAERIKSQTYMFGEKAGQRVFNPAIALAFMLFVLLYIPCIGTLTAIRKESGSIKWSIFSVIYSFCIAWMIAFATTHIGSIFIK